MSKNTTTEGDLSDFTKLLGELRSLSEQKESLRDEISKLSVAKAVAERDIAHANEIQTRSKAEAEATQLAVTQLQDRLGELRSEERRVSESLNGLSGNVSALQVEKSMIDQLLANLALTKEKLEPEIGELREARTELALEKKAFEARLQELRESVAVENGRVEEAKKRRQIVETELEEVERHRAETTKAALEQIESLRQEEASLVSTIRSLREERSLCENEITELRRQYRPLRPWQPPAALPRALVAKTKLSCQVRYIDRLAINAVLHVPGRFPGMPTTLDDLVIQALRNYLPVGEDLSAYVDAEKMFEDEEEKRREEVVAGPRDSRQEIESN